MTLILLPGESSEPSLALEKGQPSVSDGFSHSLSKAQTHCACLEGVLTSGLYILINSDLLIHTPYSTIIVI